MFCSFLLSSQSKTDAVTACSDGQVVGPRYFIQELEGEVESCFRLLESTGHRLTA